MEGIFVMLKKIIMIIVVLISSSLLFAKDTLVVGMELAYPPFEMTDEKGRPEGFSVDLAKELGEYLGREVKIENMAFGGLIPALKTNKIDVILSSMTITDQRKKSINFSIPYSKSYLTLLAGKNSPVKKPADLNYKNRVIAVKKGTTGHVVAKQYFPKAKILVFEKETACVLEVVQGKADVFIYDPLTIFKNWKKNPKTTRPIFDQFQEEVEYWGMGYRKGDDDLGEEINAFIEEFRADGGFDRLAEKHLSEQKKTFDELELPFFTDL